MSKKLTPAVGYVRMSSGHQEKSPGQQRAEIKKLAVKHGCRIVRWYTDEKISGDATEKRKQFQQMIRDAEEKGDFAVILCWDQDRFGRFDSIEAGRWIYPLREVGVRLITVAQGVIDWNDFAGRMVYSIQQEGKYQFLVDLSRNVLRGKIESAEKGRGASVPAWGYDREFYDSSGKRVKRVPYGEKFTKPRDWTLRFVVSHDTHAVETVQWMFRTFAETDCGMSWLAGDLNKRDVLSPTGRRWSVQSIQRTLTNRTYTGANVFGRKQSGKYHHLIDGGEIGEGNGHHKNGEPIVTDDIHDQIIGQETFDRVQAKLAGRRRTRTKPRNSSYILSGVLRCGHCGGPLAGKGYNGANVPRYYSCVTGNTRPGVCLRYQVQQRAIEDYVLGVIEQRLLADDTIDAIRKAVHRQAKSRRGFQDATRSLKGKVAALDEKIARGTENLLLAAPRDMDDLSGLLASWKVERTQLQTQLDRAAKNPSGESPQMLANRAVRELKRLKEHLKAADPMRVRNVVKSLVEEVRLWWEPYGKRNRRLARGVLRLRGDLEVLSPATRGR